MSNPDHPCPSELDTPRSFLPGLVGSPSTISNLGPRHGGSDSNGEKNNDLPCEPFSRTMVIEKPQDLLERPRDLVGS